MTQLEEFLALNVCESRTIVVVSSYFVNLIFLWDDALQKLGSLNTSLTIIVLKKRYSRIVNAPEVTTTNWCWLNSALELA